MENQSISTPENQIISTSNDTGKLILRLAVGGLMLFHGVYKITAGVDWMAPLLGAVGLPAFVAYGVYIGEVVAPLLIIVGWKTKLGALFLAVNMLFAIWLVNRDKIFTLKEGGAWAIELDMFYFLAALSLFFWEQADSVFQEGLEDAIESEILTIAFVNYFYKAIEILFVFLF